MDITAHYNDLYRAIGSPIIERALRRRVERELRSILESLV